MAKKEAPPSVLTEVLDNYRDSYNYSHRYHDRWDDYWRLYNNERVYVSYDGISDTFIPVTHSTVETILANVLSGKPKFTYMPTRPDQQQDTEILNALVSYYWDFNDMSLKSIPWIRDAILYGTGVLFCYWNIDHPEVKNIPLKDFFIDPTATRIENARYAGYRYLTTVSQLEKEKIIDPGTGELVPMYKNLEKIPNTGSKIGELTDKDQKDLLVGSTLDSPARQNQVECLYYITPERLVVVANRSTVIRDEENPYHRPEVEDLPEVPGFLPFAVHRNYIDGSLFYGKGDVEVFAQLQEMLNDTANQKVDNVSFAINHIWNLDPAFAHLKEKIQNVPGAINVVPAGALEPVTKPQVNAEADNEMFRLKQEIRDASGADEVVKGNASSGGRTTATEIEATLNQAGQRFAMKLATLETEGFKQLADILFKMIQVFVDQEAAVRITGPNGISWAAFNPMEYIGNYEPKVMLDANAKAQQQLDAARYQNLFQVLMNHPMINQQELLALVLEKTFQLDNDETQRLLSVDPMQALMQQLGGQEGGEEQGGNLAAPDNLGDLISQGGAPLEGPTPPENVSF